MANPQKENGYTSIANEILEALAHIRISGEARQVLDVVLRKTYGFHKKEDAISLSQFCLFTGLKKPIICRAIDKLKKMNLIIKKDNDIANIYSFNKDFDMWKPLSKKITIIKKDNEHYQKREKSLSKKIPTKDSIKDTNTKETSNEVAGIQKVINSFQEVNPSYGILFGNRTERAAAERLIKLYGEEQLLAMVAQLSKINAIPYMPTTTKPTELERNAGKIKAKLEQIKQQKVQKPKATIII